MNRPTTDRKAGTFANQRIAGAIALAVVLGAVSVPPARAQDQPSPLSAIAGEWRASVVANGVDVPFRFEIVTRGDGPVASFFNGDRRISSTGSRVQDDRVRFDFGQYAGFPSPGSGAYYQLAEHALTAEVERLLVERSGTQQ